VRLPGAIEEAMERFDPQAAVASIWELVRRANLYAEESAPWTLARSAKGGDAAADARLSTALYTLAEAVRIIAAALEPFLPATAKRIQAQLGSTLDGSWPDRLRWGGLAAGTRVEKPEPIFPRIEPPEADEPPPVGAPSAG